MGCAFCDTLAQCIKGRLSRVAGYSEMTDRQKALAVHLMLKALADYLVTMNGDRLVNLAGMGVPPDPDKGPVVPGEKR